MNIIKFSHNYPKLYGHDNQPIDMCRLLDVIPVELADLSAELIAYDTAQGSCQLPAKGNYVMLIFLKPGRIHLFTTIRRRTPEKEQYYRSKIGEIFFVQIQNVPV